MRNSVKTRPRSGGKIMRFRADASGATTIEYSLIVGLVCVVVASAASNLSGASNAVFLKISGAVAADDGVLVEKKDTKTAKDD